MSNGLSSPRWCVKRIFPDMSSPQFVVEGGRTLKAVDHAHRQQERRAPDRLRRPPHRGPGHARERAAHPGHREPAPAGPPDLGATAEWTGPNTLVITAVPSAAIRSTRALQADPRLHPARRRRSSRAPAWSPSRRRAATSSGAGVSTRTSSRSRRWGPRTSSPSGSPSAPRAWSAPTSSSTSRASPAPRTPSWPPSPPRARRCSTTPRASRTCRTSAACSWPWGRAIDGIGSNVLTIHGGAPARLHAPHRARPHRGRLVHRAGRGHALGCVIATPAWSTCAPCASGSSASASRPRIDGDGPRGAGGAGARIRSDLGGHVPKLEDQPWPAFPADVMSIAIVTATQCEGIILMHEKMFESRMFFVDKLVGMGARIVLCDPHRALVSGPTELRGRHRGDPRHPRRHGDAARGALRRGNEHVPSTTSAARSSAATSGSTNASTRSARRWQAGATGRRDRRAILDGPLAGR
jgi:hypothetical protein